MNAPSDKDRPASAGLSILIAGGGIGGMAAALACARAGHAVQLFERVAQFAEAGAGVQLGPNAVRLLHRWGLQDALQQVACAPDQIEVRHAGDSLPLACMPLGQGAQARWGAPYLTLHRADLHALLRSAAAAQGADLRAGQAVVKGATSSGATAGASLHFEDGRERRGDVAVLADGVWSGLRASVLSRDAPVRYSGHLAYRSLLPMQALPAAQRSMAVRVWLGARLHIVAYPVRAGEMLNLVVIVESDATPPTELRWTQRASADEVEQALPTLEPQLHALMGVAKEVDAWGCWHLCDRPPLMRPAQLARGAMVLLGDAAHPMLPYLAQGAAMAVEDAAVLAQLLGQWVRADALPPARADQVNQAVQAYAQARWQRVARVQAKALRNAQVFHARGPVAWGRNVALRIAGPRLMQMDWLYGADIAGG